MPEANENNAIVSARNTKQPDNNKRDATPYTLINKRKSHPKKHSISDEELLIKFNDFFLELGQRDSCISGWDKKKQRKCKCLKILEEKEDVRKSVSYFALEYGKKKTDTHNSCTL